MTVTNFDATGYGQLASSAATYALARSGGGSIGINPWGDSYVLVGQIFDGSTTWEVRQTFLKFDCTSLGTDVIDSAVLRIFGWSDETYTTNFTVEVRMKDWGAGVSYDDWVADPSTCTLVASSDTASYSWANGATVLFTDVAWAANITAGVVSVMLVSSRTTSNTAPTAEEKIEGQASGFQDGAARLTVTHSTATGDANVTTTTVTRSSVIPTNTTIGKANKTTTTVARSVVIPAISVSTPDANTANVNLTTKAIHASIPRPSVVGDRIHVPPGPTITAPVYRLALAERSSSGLGAEIISDVLGTIGGFEGSVLMYTETLNAPGTLEFSLPIDHSSVTTSNFDVGNRELHLYRDEQLVWGGKLWAADVAGWEVRMIGNGWWYDMSRRILPDDFAQHQFDQFKIVRDLVAATQAQESLGISNYDSAMSGVTRNMIACIEQRQDVDSIVQKFCDARHGMDFAVTPDKKLRLWSPERGNNSGLTFTGDNMKMFSYGIDGSDLSTEVGTVGTAKNECKVPPLYTVEDATARSHYGLLQSTLSSDLNDKADDDFINARLDEELNISKVTRFQPTVQVEMALQDLVSDPIYYGAIDIGDKVGVSIDRGAPGGFGHFTQDFRVVTMKTTVKQNGWEIMDYTLDQVID